MASDGPAETIAVLISRLNEGEERSGWLGGPKRLTGESSATAPTHRATLGAGIRTGAPSDFLWTGTCLSIHRDAPGSPQGMVLGFMDIADQAVEEFMDWYETEHMPRLAALPGIFRAARYRATSPFAPRFLALYQMEDIAISQSPEWMAAARTPWSARMRRFSRNYSRYSFSRKGGGNR